MKGKDRFKQSPANRVISPPSEPASVEESDDKSCCQIVKNYWWILMLLFLVMAYLVSVIKQPIFTRRLYPHEEYKTSHSFEKPTTEEPLEIKQNDSQLIPANRCPQPCDYSDIINQKTIKKVFDNVSRGKYDAVNKLMSGYLSPLSSTSNSPYKDEKIWVQNFNNMQKVFDSDYWFSVKELMNKLHEKTAELNSIGTEISDLSAKAANHTEQNACLSELNTAKSILSSEKKLYDSKAPKVAEIDKRISGVEDKLKSLQKALSDDLIEHSKLINGYDAKIAELNAYLARRLTLKKESDKWKIERANILERIASLKFQMKPNKDSLAEFESKNKGLEKELIGLRKEDEELTEQNRKLKLRVSILFAKRNMVDEIRNLVDVETSTNERFKELVSKSEHSKEDINSYISSIDKTLSPDHIEVTIKGSEFEAGASSLSDVYGPYHRLREKIKSFKDNEAEIQIKIQALKEGEQKLKSLHEKIASVELKIQTNKREIQKLSDLLKENENQLHIYENRSKELLKEIDGLDLDTSKEEKEIAKYQAKKEAKQHEFNVF